MRIHRGLPVLGAGLLAVAAHAADSDNLSSLEQVTVTAKHDNGTSLGGVSITQQDMQLFNRDTLDTAIALAPGAA
ncbi:MAG TPA: hypothetical protein VMB48_07875, partial [Steroidobacteraceae bacterium]|nr:hypothetical protein [Steroidobacteraceae bacterium]